jgi:hypothetical protein
MSNRQGLSRRFDKEVDKGAAIMKLRATRRVIVEELVQEFGGQAAGLSTKSPSRGMT